MSVKQGGKTIAGATQYHPDLFDFKWADHILDDAQWLMTNPFSWQYGSMYQAAYANLSAAIAGKTLQSETVAGVTVQFYLADDGHKICPNSEEDKVLSIYNKTGNAWYYIIDTINQRFKLPRRHSQKIVRSVKNADGSWYRLYADGWVEQGGETPGESQSTALTINLPVIMASGNYYVGITSTVASNGFCFRATSRTTTTFVLQPDYFASSANPTGSKVWQVSGQSAIDMSSFQDGEKYLYFYVGAFTQAAIENTAGLNVELFNNKADLNLNNISSSGKETAVSWGMPDYSAGISLSGWGTATSNFSVPTDGVLQIVISSTSALEEFFVDEKIACALANVSNYTGWAVNLFPVSKGTHAWRTSSNPSRIYAVVFYPFKGVN